MRKSEEFKRSLNKNFKSFFKKTIIATMSAALLAGTAFGNAGNALNTKDVFAEEPLVQNTQAGISNAELAKKVQEDINATAKVLLSQYNDDKKIGIYDYSLVIELIRSGVACDKEVKQFLDAAAECIKDGKLIVNGKENVVIYAAVLEVLALTNKDARDFNGANLVAAFDYMLWSYVMAEDLDKDIDSLYYYEVLAPAIVSYAPVLSEKGTEQIEKVKTAILRNYSENAETNEAGFDYYGFSADTNAVVLNGLLKTMSQAEIKGSTPVKKSIALIKELTNEDKGVSYSKTYGGSNADTTALVLKLYAEMGEEALAKSAYEGLCAFKSEKTPGMYTYAGEDSIYSARDAFKGLVSYKMALLGEGSTFDVSKNVKEITAKEKYNQLILSKVGKVTKTVGDKDFSADVLGVTAMTEVTFSVDNGKVLKYYPKTNTFKIIGAGNAKIKVKAVETEEFNSATKYISVVVNKKNQKVTATSKYVKTYGNRAFKLSAKAWGNPKFSYTSSNKNVAVVNSNGQVTIKSCGVAKIKIKALEDATHKSATKTVVVNINPKKQSIKSVKAGNKKIGLKVTKDTKVSGYQVTYSLDKKFKSSVTKKFKGNAKTDINITNLKAGKTYYVKVRAYKDTKDGSTYGAYSAVKSVKVK